MSKIAEYKHRGEVMDWVNGTGNDVKVGDVVSLGTFCGVAQVDIPNGGTGPLGLTGVYEIDAVSNAAFDQGDLLYYDVAANKATKDESKAFLGVAMRGKLLAGTKAFVKIGYEWHDHVKAEAAVNHKNTSGAKIEAGDVVAFDDFIGVAAEEIANNATGRVYITGTFELAAVTNAAFDPGDALFYDNSALQKVDTNPAIPAGICVAAKATAGDKALVYLCPGVPRAAAGA